MGNLAIWQFGNGQYRNRQWGNSQCVQLVHTIVSGAIPLRSNMAMGNIAIGNGQFGNGQFGNGQFDNSKCLQFVPSQLL